MIKRLGVFIAASVFILALAGCSSNTSAGSSASASPSSENVALTSSATSSLFASDDWPQNELTEGVPVPRFSVGSSSINTNPGFLTITYKGVPASEVESYVSLVKEAGFTYDASELKSDDRYSYNAYNTEDFSSSSNVAINYSKDGELSITVINVRLTHG